jgi:hypothetical protein
MKDTNRIHDKNQFSWELSPSIAKREKDREREREREEREREWCTILNWASSARPGRYFARCAFRTASHAVGARSATENVLELVPQA